MDTETKKKGKSQKRKTLIAQEKVMNSIRRYIDFLYYISIASVIIGLFVLLSIYP